MKKRIAIYGGTELSAAESRFTESLAYRLLKTGDVIIITGGFLYWPAKTPGAISTDFSVLEGARKYAVETGVKLEEILETWLPDPEVENDPDKKEVVRFREGFVQELKGESAQARRFSMIRDVDLLITVKGKRHTSMVLDFALTLNKPAFPLAFTGGDSRAFWEVNKERVKKWFALSDELADDFAINNMEQSWGPVKKEAILNEILNAVKRGLETETENEQYYREVRDRIREDSNMKNEAKLFELVNPAGAINKQANVFVSYAHKDAELVDELDKSLTALKRDQRISLWRDTQKIRGGDDYEVKIKDALQNADIILLLISADFIDSDYIWEKELPLAKQKHEEGNTHVIPIFLRDVFVKNMWFTSLQGYISMDKPVAGFKGYDRDTALKTVVQGISDDIDEWLLGKK